MFLEESVHNAVLSVFEGPAVRCQYCFQKYIITGIYKYIQQDKKIFITNFQHAGK